MALNPTLSEVDGGPVQYASSIWAGLQAAFRRNASRTAVISLHQRPDHLSALVGKTSPAPRYLAWTFDQLLRGGVVVAAAWQDAGIKTGDTLVTFIPNGADHCVLRMAAIICKLNFTALDLGMTTPARIAELQHMFTLLKPAVVVVADSAAAQAVDAASKVVGVSPLLRLTANWDGEVDKDSLWQDLNQSGSSEALKQERHDALLREALTDDHDRVSAILFTSGTSMGAPKGCPKTVLNAIHTLNIAPQRLPGVWTVRLVDTANFRAICNAVSLTTWADDGTFVVSGGSPTPASMIQAIAETKVTDIFLLPAIVRLIADHPDYSVEKMETVTTVGIGGDVVTRSMLALSEEVFPNVKAFNVHGSSEGSKLFDWAYCDPVQPYFGEVPSIGKVWPGVRVKAVNTEGSVVPRGTPGELHISSSAMISHYLEGVSQASFYKDGQRQWFNAGDMVVIDKDGFIYITGRTKDIIKRIGVPITPGVVETCLAAYTGAVVTVVDVPHAEYGAEPYAIMSTFGGKTIEQLKARVVEMLGKDYALGGAVPLSELGLEAWPLNATDKVNKIELKAALKSRLGTM